MLTKKKESVHPKTTKKCCGFVMDRQISTKNGSTTTTDTCQRCRQRDVATVAAKENNK